MSTPALKVLRHALEFQSSRPKSLTSFITILLGNVGQIQISVQKRKKKWKSNFSPLNVFEWNLSTYAFTKFKEYAGMNLFFSSYSKIWPWEYTNLDTWLTLPMLYHLIYHDRQPVAFSESLTFSVPCHESNGWRYKKIRRYVQNIIPSLFKRHSYNKEQPFLLLQEIRVLFFPEMLSREEDSMRKYYILYRGLQLAHCF